MQFRPGMSTQDSSIPYSGMFYSTERFIYVLGEVIYLLIHQGLRGLRRPGLLPDAYGLVQ